MKSVMKILVCFFLLWGNATQAAVLTFDDLGGNQIPIPNGYGGLNWSNMYVLDTSTFQPSGYVNGVVSGTNVAYNAFANLAIVSQTNFDFNGAYFTAAWNDGLSILAEGKKNGVLLFSQQITVNTNAPTFFGFNFSGIDSLYLSSFGGIDNPLYGGQGEHFAMDNFTYNNTVVPVPAAIWLFGSGLMGLLRFTRRKSVSQAIAT